MRGIGTKIGIVLFWVFMCSYVYGATVTLTRGKTLPDTGTKSDLHDLIDQTTATVSNITNSDIDANAAIAGTKINPDFGGQNITTTGDLTCDDPTFDDITCDKITASETVALSSTLTVYDTVTASQDLTVGNDAYVTGHLFANNQYAGVTTKAFDTVYEATNDTYVFGYATGGGSGDPYVTVYFDGNNPPTTARQKSGIGNNDHNPFGCIVPKGNYYKVAKEGTGTLSGAVYIVEND